VTTNAGNVLVYDVITSEFKRVNIRSTEEGREEQRRISEESLKGEEDDWCGSGKQSQSQSQQQQSERTIQSIAPADALTKLSSGWSPYVGERAKRSLARSESTSLENENENEERRDGYYYCAEEPTRSGATSIIAKLRRFAPRWSLSNEWYATLRRFAPRAPFVRLFLLLHFGANDGKEE